MKNLETLDKLITLNDLIELVLDLDINEEYSSIEDHPYLGRAYRWYMQGFLTERDFKAQLFREIDKYEEAL